MRYRVTTHKPIAIGRVGSTRNAAASEFDTDYELGPPIQVGSDELSLGTIAVQPLRNGEAYGPTMYLYFPESNLAGIADLDCG